MTKYNTVKGAVTITGSKSESNRLLVLQQLFPALQIENLATSDDTVLLQKALFSEAKEIDIHHAGTAMRFLTAYLATQVNKDVILTGSTRMQQRPIQILVAALEQLGAKIKYVKKEGYPPLHIFGNDLVKNSVTLKAAISSQYISALLLIAPKLKNGLIITLEGAITSRPYINMTLALLKQLGVETIFEKNMITVKPFDKIAPTKTIVVEADWSAASYFYSMIALSKSGTVTLHNFKKNSLQGDACLAAMYEKFGVATTFQNNKMTLQKVKTTILKHMQFDLHTSPDIAQTIAVTCLALGVSCGIKGLHTLKIKETDRLQALKNELEKFGGKVRITNDSLHLKAPENIKKNVVVKTYDDHRMAMSFAPLCLKTTLEIEDAAVVSKSYPAFWTDIKSVLQ